MVEDAGMTPDLISLHRSMPSLCAALFSVLVTACGGGSDSAGSNTEQRSSAGAPVPVSPAGAAETPPVFVSGVQGPLPDANASFVPAASAPAGPVPDPPIGLEPPATAAPPVLVPVTVTPTPTPSPPPSPPPGTEPTTGPVEPPSPPATGAAGVSQAPAPDADLASLLPAYPASTTAGLRAGDTVFSPRFDRPDAPAVAQSFGANRAVWSYVTAPASVQALQAAVGSSLGGAINNNSATPNDSGSAIDFDGRPIVAPWQTSWNAPWNSCVRPAAMQAKMAWIDRLLALGMRSIQLDDPDMQLGAEYWGAGDFSPESMQGFANWVRQQNAAGANLPLSPEAAADYGNWLRQQHGVVDAADYRARRATFPSGAVFRSYLRDAVTDCIAQLRQHIVTRSGGTATFSTNLHTPFPWSANAFLVPLSDQVIGELDLSQSAFHHVAFISQWLRAGGRPWLFLVPVENTAQVRHGIAVAFAHGAWPVVPWDQWMPPPTLGAAPPARHFGTVADYGAIYSFARAQSPLLQGWETLSRLNLLAYADGVVPANALAQLQRLAARQVPFRPVVRSPGLGAGGQRPAAPVHTTLRLSNDRSQVSDPQPLLSATSDTTLDALAAARNVTAGINVVVKGHAAQPGRRVVHVVKSGGSANTVSLTLAPWVLPQATRYAVVLHRPGQAPQDLGNVVVGASGLNLTLPAVGTWAIAEVSAVP